MSEGKLLAACRKIENILHELRKQECDSEGHEGHGQRAAEFLKQIRSLDDERALGRFLQRGKHLLELMVRERIPSVEEFRNLLDDSCPQIINCDAKPIVPSGLKIWEHTKQGMVEWRPERFQFYRSPLQEGCWQLGKGCSGSVLLQELRDKNKQVCNACLADWLLGNPRFVLGDKWREGHCSLVRVIFWGTIFSEVSGKKRYVKHLSFGGPFGLHTGVIELDQVRFTGGTNFDQDSPALIMVG
ncbi:hypothetical protein A3K24_00215 [candidate division Kazan bacterium RIFCSPHIGHO2_01_FULL_44_14]|uniref:Uncharacterized protein n=1 Tax=candidate division Kazan bacterium RIFCSPLOWO2_01_FULL_45_19 TaxID=1798538 RepID=A0A1F4NQX4_UNCK3|nr:MAG: hypothetical protein A3K51_00215 [candidate division Kazan bacterium RIFCSPLOWO2_01_FULL_45_19]OGB77537.1 MAG: hypothetical protein A3K24_00215 [candidate division Kazan bacterium RIFCSPHIGHO2_01_FULL_44_14]